MDFENQDNENIFFETHPVSDPVKFNSDLMKLIQQMAEVEGMALTPDQKKALLDRSKQFLELITQDTFPDSDSTSVPFQDDTEDDSEDDTEEISPDPQTSTAQDECEERSSTCAKDTQFLEGYPMPDVYPIEELQPRLLRRILMPSPCLPHSVLSRIRKPGVLWCIMRNMGFEENKKIKESMSHKHAVRNLYWKAALAATFRCYDAFFFLKHAALRCTRKDFDSACTLYNVAMNHILRKLLLEANKKTEREKYKHRIDFPITEVIPLTLRKYYRSEKKVCKVKPLWLHYIYRNRSLFKKPYRVINATLKQSITAIAFSDPKNRYCRKYIPDEVMAENIVISDYEDGTHDWQYNFQHLLSDEDNLFLKEDVSRILKRTKKPHAENNDNDPPNPRNITKTRLDNFFKHFDDGLMRIILERYLESGEVKDWIDEIDLPILIDGIERKDELEKKNKCNDPNTIESETDSNKFDEMVHSVLTQDYTETTYTIEIPCNIVPWISGKGFCDKLPFPVLSSDSSKKKDAELFQVIQKRYLAILEEEKNNN